MASLRQGLHTGWLEAMDIPRLIGRFPWLTSPDRWALLTMLDSGGEVADAISIPPLAERLQFEPVRVGQSVAVSGRVLRGLAEAGLFTGFDELWLFDAPPREDRPSSLRLIADAPQSPPSGDALARWLASSGCRLCVGDGFGLNYVTFDTGLRGTIERLAAAA
jgi:hypothetical protein